MLLFTNIHSPFPTLLKEFISIPHWCCAWPCDLLWPVESEWLSDLPFSSTNIKNSCMIHSVSLYYPLCYDYCCSFSLDAGRKQWSIRTVNLQAVTELAIHCLNITCGLVFYLWLLQQKLIKMLQYQGMYWYHIVSIGKIRKSCIIFKFFFKFFYFFIFHLIF